MIESCHDSCDGIRSTFSDGPDDVTSTFWRYSSTAASMSVELSLLLFVPSSLPRQLSIIASFVVMDDFCCWWAVGLSGSPVGGAIVSVEVSCSSSSRIMVFRGDVGSPNSSHSRSNSSVRDCFLCRCFFGIDTMDGLLRHRKIRRDTSPTPLAVVAAAVDRLVCDCCKIVDALLTECRNDVAVGFSWL